MKAQVENMNPNGYMIDSDLENETELQIQEFKQKYSKSNGEQPLVKENSSTHHSIQTLENKRAYLRREHFI